MHQNVKVSCLHIFVLLLVTSRSETSEIPAFFTVYRFRNKVLSEEIVVSFYCMFSICTRCFSCCTIVVCIELLSKQIKQRRKWSHFISFVRSRVAVIINTVLFVVPWIGSVGDEMVWRDWTLQVLCSKSSMCIGHRHGENSTVSNCILLIGRYCCKVLFEGDIFALNRVWFKYDVSDLKCTGKVLWIIVQFNC